ncbi:MAG TPA: ABC transporter permease subunit [Methylomirabilota bacterium]|nr:ABC transporter permease subunit [Methylomirabilota bacterium]
MECTVRAVTDAAVRAVRGRRRPDLLTWLPTVTLALFLAPVGAGLLGTWLPAFGWLPSLGGHTITLAPWGALLAAPELPGALRLTLTTGLLASVASFCITIGFCAAAHGTYAFRAIERLLAPVLAMPHAAVALGLAFLIAPSGWLARLLSPWATGWLAPPALATVQDPWGLALTLGLVAKEVPYLLLMTIAASAQVEAKESLAIARSLGYGPTTAWLKGVLPRVYPQIRMPIYAVLAYSLSVVDMALILAPATPPPLAPLLLRWFAAPDLDQRFTAAAGATLQFLLVVGAIAAWRLLEAVAAWVGRRSIAGGRRGGGGYVPRAFATAGMIILLALAAGSLAANAIWSLADRWRFPAPLPTAWTLATWQRHASNLGGLALTTVTVGIAATAAALALALGCLENEKRHALRFSNRGLWLIYTPLLVPQVSFLFGLQVLLVSIHLDGTWVGLVWSHLLFVLPYVFLSLADPYRSLDDRYARSALCLGATPNRVFWRVKLPMLRQPALVALAVGFAVSAAQYLPTLFAGAGRFDTLTTEAVGLAAGADRRVIGVYALVQALLPLLAFALAVTRRRAERPARSAAGRR